MQTNGQECVEQAVKAFGITEYHLQPHQLQASTHKNEVGQKAVVFALSTGAHTAPQTAPCINDQHSPAASSVLCR
jgi:hypothetical protein